MILLVYYMFCIHFKGKDGSINGECQDYDAAYLVKDSTCHNSLEDFVCEYFCTYRLLMLYVYLSVKNTCHHLFAVVCLTH